MAGKEVIHPSRSSLRAIDPLNPGLSEGEEQRLSTLHQLVHTIAVDMHLRGEDPRRHKREIYRQAREAAKSWMNS